MQPSVSIVLPVFNGEKYLASSIESVLDQSFTDFELILVNDCSTDSTEEIIRRYAAQNPRIVYLKNEVNLKLPASLNRGFSAAKGQYYSWTSDDNLYHKEAIQKMVAFLEEHPDVSMVYCDYNRIDAEGTLIGSLKVGSPQRLIYGNNVGACFLYKAEVAKTIGEYRTDYFLVEDYEYWLRINLHYKIAPLNETLYDHRMHAGNLTLSRKQEIAAILDRVQWEYFYLYDRFGRLSDDPSYSFHQLLKRETSRKKRLGRMLRFTCRHPSYIKTLIHRILHGNI